jgi:DNA-binding transcriptional ArsR family regulator
MSNQATHPNQESLRKALASPQRLELVGHFVESKSMSISDMAARSGRPATSLYHHVQVLEETGVLVKDGVRRKGKRFENLYRLSSSRLELELGSDDQDAREHAIRAMGTALRMAERDFAAAVNEGRAVPDGPERNLIGLRLHMRISADGLATLNEHLSALETLLMAQAAEGGEPEESDQFVSLTLVVAPQRGRLARSRKGTEDLP